MQTDLSWEDLSDVIGKALDERLSVLHESAQAAIKNLEQGLSARLRNLREELLNGQAQLQLQPDTENPPTMHEVLRGIDHLEHIIESMQVAMTANHALLSNRLYHHQQLPLERAHASDHTPSTTISPPNGTSTPRSLTGERGGQ